jgi:hypothetical protein
MDLYLGHSAQYTICYVKFDYLNTYVLALSRVILLPPLLTTTWGPPSTAGMGVVV